jgi:hypothetical protein
MVKLQVPVPWQAPDQPANEAPLAAVAVSVTTVPAGYNLVQVGLQLMPAGLLTTVPVALPDSWTSSLYLVTVAALAKTGRKTITVKMFVKIAKLRRVTNDPQMIEFDGNRELFG